MVRGRSDAGRDRILAAKTPARLCVIRGRKAFLIFQILCHPKPILTPRRYIAALMPSLAFLALSLLRLSSSSPRTDARARVISYRFSVGSNSDPLAWRD